MTDITHFSQCLASITCFHLISRSGVRSHCAWSGSGHGRVLVSQAAESLRFYEQGGFQLEHSRAEVAVRNIYRWDLHDDHIALFHERRGKENAVWLFDLVSDASDNALVSRHAHLCGADRYSARLTLQPQGFDLNWCISGPRKDERLFYRYR